MSCPTCERMNTGEHCRECARAVRSVDKSYGKKRGNCPPEPIMDACIYACHSFPVVSGEFEIKLKQGNLPENTVLGLRTGDLLIRSNRGSGHYLVEALDSALVGTTVMETDCLLPGRYLPTQLIDTSRKLCATFVIPEAAASDATNPPTSILLVDQGGFNVGDLARFPDGTAYRIEGVNASSEGFSYNVSNTAGLGGNPGSVVNPWGDSTDCTEKKVVIQRESGAQICPVGTSNVASHFMFCPEGSNSTRAFVGVRDGDIGVWNASTEEWNLGMAPELPCCLTTTACLKFIPAGGLTQVDTVAINSSDVACFQAYYDGIISQNKQPIVLVSGDKYAVQDFNGSEITLKVTGKDEINIEYDIGTQICVAECCEGCETNSFSTDFNPDPNPAATPASQLPVIAVSALTDYNLSAGTQEFIIGLDSAGSGISLECNAANEASGAIVVTALKPESPTPAVLRAKFCPNNCCAENHEFCYNYKLATDMLPDGIEVEYKILSFVFTSETLCDNVELAPSTVRPSTSQIVFGETHQGPSFLQPSKILQTGVLRPSSCDYFEDYGFTPQNFCLDTELYLVAFVRKTAGSTAPDVGQFRTDFISRRAIKSRPRAFRALPDAVAAF